VSGAAASADAEVATARNGWLRAGWRFGYSGRAAVRHWRNKPDQLFEVLDSSSEQKLVCSAGYPAQPQAPEAEIALDGSAFSEINFAP
jgi:hypothetical protein